jgi:hypothetical protein
MPEASRSRQTPWGVGEGFFQRAGDGKWLAVLEVGRDPATGKHVRRTITAPTRRAAAERLRILRDQLDRDAVNIDARATIAQWSERWLEHVRYRRDAIGDMRANTAASYERLTRVHVVGRLGAVRLAQLTPGHVGRACRAIRQDAVQGDHDVAIDPRSPTRPAGRRPGRRSPRHDHVEALRARRQVRHTQRPPRPRRQDPPGRPRPTRVQAHPGRARGVPAQPRSHEPTPERPREQLAQPDHRDRLSSSPRIGA